MLTKLRTENDVSREDMCDMSAEPKQNPADYGEEFLRGNIKQGDTLEVHAAGEQLAFNLAQPQQGEPANGSPLRSRGDAEERRGRWILGIASPVTSPSLVLWSIPETQPLPRG